MNLLQTHRAGCCQIISFDMFGSVFYFLLSEVSREAFSDLTCRPTDRFVALVRVYLCD